MNLRVRYFAALREQRGCSEESLTTSATTARALYAELRQRHEFRYTTDHLQVALDAAFCTWDTPLTDGVEVSFIPPVSGG